MHRHGDGVEAEHQPEGRGYLSSAASLWITAIGGLQAQAGMLKQQRYNEQK